MNYGLTIAFNDCRSSSIEQLINRIPVQLFIWNIVPIIYHIHSNDNAKVIVHRRSWTVPNLLMSLLSNAWGWFSILVSDMRFLNYIPRIARYVRSCATDKCTVSFVRLHYTACKQSSSCYVDLYIAYTVIRCIIQSNKFKIFAYFTIFYNSK